jgi:hypothetical protein
LFSQVSLPFSLGRKILPEKLDIPLHQPISTYKEGCKLEPSPRRNGLAVRVENSPVMGLNLHQSQGVFPRRKRSLATECAMFSVIFAFSVFAHSWRLEENWRPSGVIKESGYRGGRGRASYSCKLTAHDEGVTA